MSKRGRSYRTCHDYDFSFNLLDYLFAEFALDAELDRVLYMEKTPQTWGASFLYQPDESLSAVDREVVAPSSIAE